MDCTNELCFYHIPKGHKDREYYSQGCENGREGFPEICGLPDKYEQLQKENERLWGFARWVTSHEGELEDLLQEYDNEMKGVE